MALYCSPGINLTSLSCGKMAFEAKVVKTKKRLLCQWDCSTTINWTGCIFSSITTSVSVPLWGLYAGRPFFFPVLRGKSTEDPIMSSSVCAFL